MSALRLTPEQLQAARDWLADCQWADMSATDFATLAPETVEKGVERAYDGGLDGFLRDYEPVPCCPICGGKTVDGNTYDSVRCQRAGEEAGR